MTIKIFDKEVAEVVEHAVNQHFGSEGTGIPEDELLKRLAGVGVLISSGTLNDLHRLMMSDRLEKRKGVGWLPAGCPDGIGRFGSLGTSAVLHRDPASIPEEFVKDLKEVLVGGFNREPKGFGMARVVAKLEDKYPNEVKDAGFLQTAILGRCSDVATIGRGPYPIQPVKKPA